MCEAISSILDSRRVPLVTMLVCKGSDREKSRISTKSFLRRGSPPSNARIFAGSFPEGAHLASKIAVIRQLVPTKQRGPSSKKV